MSKRKICVVVASRANYARIKSVLSAINAHQDLELQLVVTASALLYRFGNAVDIIERDGFKISSKTYYIVEGENPVTMAKSTGLAIVDLSTIFDNLKPDIVLTVADRFETLATAVASSYMNIPLAHTQGGEMTGSIDESVRHAITKLSQIHFPATEKSKEILIKMGENPEYIFNVGCPSIDIVKQADKNINHDDFKQFGGVGGPIDPRKPYLIVLQHPVTTEYNISYNQMDQTLQAVRMIGIQALILWPNVDAGSEWISKRIRIFNEQHPEPIYQYVRNLPVESYIKAISNCSCVVGNSSSGIREGSYLGVPCVNIGNRQNKRERATNVIDVVNKTDLIYKSICMQLVHGKYEPSFIYGDGNAGIRIANILSKIDVKIQKELRYEV